MGFAPRADVLRIEARVAAAEQPLAESVGTLRCDGGAATGADASVHLPEADLARDHSFVPAYYH